MFRRLMVFGTFILLITGLLLPLALPVRAAETDPTPTSTPEPNKRVTEIKDVTFTWYDWWLVKWADNHVMCRILVEHQGSPTGAEIKHDCGDTSYQSWKATQPCPAAANGGETSSCTGMYLHYLGTFPGKRNVVVNLPTPTVWLSITNCNPEPVLNRCTAVPTLHFTGEEPLPNEVIIRINGILDGQPFSCAGSACDLPLQPTGTQGASIEFWADSSFGDSSVHYTGMVRVVPWGGFMSPDKDNADPSMWYADIISSQWRDGNIASCSDTWQSFPDIGGPPPWLSTPNQLGDLATNKNYYYLAGLLIKQGVVDGSSCPAGGLADPNTANECGLQAAMPKVVEWQNSFDTEILKVAKDTGVPAQLMKNIFSRESQFWPGIYTNYKEAGLGHLTENGADTVLLWNPDFFAQFCPLALDQSTCNLGFGNLKPEQQALLRGALVTSVNAACPDCAIGVDLAQANFSIKVFAESLKANCEQTGRAITNITGNKPGQVTSYVDLWKFTLVNYNAGIGCLAYALNVTRNSNQSINWETVSSHLQEVCQPSINYVSDISEALLPTPTPTAWVFIGTNAPAPVYPTSQPFSPTPTALKRTGTPIGPTPTPTRSITPGGPTPTRTSTGSGYPYPGGGAATITPGPSPTPPSYP